MSCSLDPDPTFKPIHPASSKSPSLARMLFMKSLLEPLVAWLKMVSLHSQSSQIDDFAALKDLAERKVIVPECLCSDEIFALISDVKSAVASKTVDTTISTRIDRILGSLSEQFPSFVAPPTPHPARGALTSPSGFSPSPTLFHTSDRKD
jgi:hypothetical protein